MASKSSKQSKTVIFEEEPVSPSANDEFNETKPSTVENIISVVLGLAVVLVIGAMIVNVIRNRNNPTDQTAQNTEDQKSATISATHVVASGETLWSIAEQYYKDGFKWTEIQKANNLPSGSVEKGSTLIIPKLEEVAIVVTPVTSVTPTIQATESPTAAPSAAPTNTPMPSAAPSATSMPSVAPTLSPATGTGSVGPTGGLVDTQGQTSSASTDRQYTIIPGDTLWDISVKKYNDGYRWTEIAKMNNLSQPDVIHAGNVLLMP